MRFFPLALVAFAVVISIVNAGHLYRHHRRYRRNGYRLDLREAGTPRTNTTTTTIEVVALPSNIINLDAVVSRSPSNDTTSDSSPISQVTCSPTSQATCPVFQVTDLQACLSNLTTWINNWVFNTIASDTPLPQGSVTNVSTVLQEHQENLKDFITAAEAHATAAIALQLADLQGFLVGFGEWTATWIALAKTNGTSSRDAIAALQEDATQHENDMASWISQANSPASTPISLTRLGGVTVTVTPATGQTSTIASTTKMVSMTEMQSTSSSQTDSNDYSSTTSLSALSLAAVLTLPTLRPMHASITNLTVSVVPVGAQKQPGVVADCNRYYLTQKGQSCTAIANITNISLNDLYKWNTGIGDSTYEKLLADAYACVGVSTSSASAAASSTPASASAQPSIRSAASAAPSSATIAFPPAMLSVTSVAPYLVAANSSLAAPAPSGTLPVVPQSTTAPPSSISAGMNPECKAFYNIQAGDTCSKIQRQYASITVNDILKWNSAIGSKCEKLMPGKSICIGLSESIKPGNNSMAAPSGALPSAVLSASGALASEAVSSAAVSSAAVSSAASSMGALASAVTSSSRPTPIAAAPSAVPSSAAAATIVIASISKAHKAIPAAASDIVSLSMPPLATLSTSPLVHPTASLRTQHAAAAAISTTPSGFSTALPSASSTAVLDIKPALPAVVTSLAPSAAVQSGLTSKCKQYYKVCNGQTCASIRGSTPLTDIVAWNPALGSNCARLVAGDYICVGIEGSPNFTPPPGCDDGVPSALSHAKSTVSTNVAFDASSDSTLAAYYGQTDASASISLSTVCAESPATIVVLGFVDKFFSAGGYPSLTLNALPGSPMKAAEKLGATGLTAMPALQSNISMCQKMGKLVLLSLGGAAAESNFTSAAQAEQFASTLWDLFGGGKNATVQAARPFGNITVDGFDIDNESQDPSYYAEFTSQLRRLYAQDSSKPYYITGAPQCPRPDASIPLNAMLMMDFVWPQFYNNPACNANETGFAASLQAWSKDLELGKGGNGQPTKLFVGAPSYPQGQQGWQEAPQLAAAVKSASVGLENLGGVMLWDAAMGMIQQEDVLGTVVAALGRNGTKAKM